MAGDIVERLRYWHSEQYSTTPRPIDLEAALEIERLRKEANAWQALAHRYWKEEPEDCECRACEVYEELEVHQ